MQKESITFSELAGSHLTMPPVRVLAEAVFSDAWADARQAGERDMPPTERHAAATVDFCVKRDPGLPFSGRKFAGTNWNDQCRFIQLSELYPIKDRKAHFGAPEM